MGHILSFLVVVAFLQSEIICSKGSHSWNTKKRHHTLDRRHLSEKERNQTAIAISAHRLTRHPSKTCGLLSSDWFSSILFEILQPQPPLHEDPLPWPEDEPSSSQTPPPSPQRKVFSYSCLHASCSSLGNIFDGIASVALFSLITEKHSFSVSSIKIPLREYYQIPITSEDSGSIALTHDLFGKNAEKFKKEIKNSGEFPLSDSSSLTISTNEDFLPTLLLNNETKRRILTLFGTTEPEVIRGCVLRSLLRPKPSLLFMSAPLFQQIAGVIVAVHITLGEKTFLKTAISSVDFVERFIECFLSHTEDMTERPYIFLTSDSPRAISMFQEKVPESQLLFAPLLSVHCQNQGKCRNVHDNLILTHFLLSRADSLLLSYNDFSKSAALFGGHEGSIYYTEFCECTKGKKVQEFLINDQWSRSVPHWTRSKCGFK